MEHALLELADLFSLLEAKREVAALLDELREALGLHRRIEEFLGRGRLQRLVVLREVAARDVEAGERILDRRRVHVADEVVEVSERRTAFHGVLGSLRDVEGVGGHDARNDAPDLALVVDDVVLRVLRLDDARHLPHAVVAALVRIVLELLVAVLRHLVHVLHDLLGLREHVAVHALEDDLSLREGVAVNGEVGVVDVAVAERLQRNETALDVELVDQQGEFHGRKTFVEGD